MQKHKFLLFSMYFVVANGCLDANAGFLTAEKFPTDINNISFSDQMANKAAGYEPYKDASPYMHVQLQSVNDALADEVERIEKEHELYCSGAGANRPECLPYEPDKQPEQEPKTKPDQQQKKPKQEQQPKQEKKPKPEQGSGNRSQGEPGTYCAQIHPNIPSGQTLPLGVPVSPKLDIYAKAQRGLVCSGFAVNRGGGHTHQGNDLGCNKKYFDSPVFATADGVVSIVKPDNPQSTAGNYIVIKHADGFESWYMHLNSILVTQGQRIQAGCQIGTMGYTGGSLGAKKQGKPFRMGIDITHLHYELHNTNHAPTMNTPKGPIKLKYGRGKAFDPIDTLKYK